MLKESLIANTRPQAAEENIVRWRNYRITVLGERLFRLEQNDGGIFCDEATQSIWFRDMPPQRFTVREKEKGLVIQTAACRLIITKERGQVCVEFKNGSVLLDNAGNLFGTYRTLDCCDGDTYYQHWVKGSVRRKITLLHGVCAKNGVAVLADTSYLLGRDGEVKNRRAEGSDEYVFAFEKDYRGAVRALYALTGYPPLVPRFALGNWWSRYHAYTAEEYLQTLAAFAEREIPLSVATVDMDWHYSERVNEQKGVEKQGKLSPEYVGECATNLGWTGYSWNRELFPDPAGFLREIKSQGLKITLNVHPSDGVRFWEDSYAEMAEALGVDSTAQRQIPFAFTSPSFINAYFAILHRPHEAMGVDFWWIDWQQPNIPWQEGEGSYDPLWALNHYHYLDNAANSQTPLVLSRYAGIGAHRYPLGFSGDTYITWKSLAYLPYFTATASNIGYTWWSHDIGGHMQGEKSDELYLRQVQLGTFSPVNRLHCSVEPTMTKEPWAYLNGTGLLAARFLRFRHALVPYLYTASKRTHEEGIALVEPLYYEWQAEEAYAFSTEYRFGSELLVCPVVTKAEQDGYARVQAWLPEGSWTDIFTGDCYEIGAGGKKVTLHRTLDSIPVLCKAGGILPLSTERGNGCPNPESIEVWAYLGDNEYTLYEDGKEEGKTGEAYTHFSARQTQTEGVCMQSLQISVQEKGEVLPQNRTLCVRFKQVKEGRVRLFVDGREVPLKKWRTDCAAARFALERGKTYEVQVTFPAQDRLSKWKERAARILLQAEGGNGKKYDAYRALQKAKTEEEFLSAIQNAPLLESVKARLLEVV